MSNSEADVPQDTASDVIGNSRPSPGDAGGQLQDDISPLASTSQDPNLKNRPTIPKNDRTTKLTTYRPTRTSSAPPEEHVADAHKSHFQPTKTQQSFLSSNEQGRRVPNYNQSTGRALPSYNNRSSDESGPSSSQGNSAPDSTAGDSPHTTGAGGDNSIPSSGAPSPHGGPDQQTGGGGAGPNHIPLAPLSPAMRSASGDHGSFHGSSGQNSPVYHGHQSQNRGFRNNGPPPHSNDRSPYLQGQNGPGGFNGPGNYNNNREPYNNRPSGDYRENGGGRSAGRTNRRAPQGGAFGGRGPNMNQMHDGPGPMSPPSQMNPRVNFVPNTPPQQQWVQFDAFTGAQIPTGPGPGPGSPYQQHQQGPPNSSYPAGAPIPPGGRPQGMMQGGQQQRGPHQGPNQGPHQVQGSPQQQIFVPQHPQAQQQMMQQQQQNMMVQQHFIMHNQAQQQFMPQQMFVPYGMEISPDQVMLMEMQNQHNMQVQNMQNMQNMNVQTVRAPNGQIMHVVPGNFPMGMVQPQQIQGMPFQQHAPHMQQLAHQGMPGQQVFLQEVQMPYGQPPQMVQIPVHIQQGGAPGVPHMQPGMMPNTNFNNYPSAVTGMPHVPPSAQHYNPSLPAQYGPLGNQTNRVHGAPHDQAQGPGQNQGPGPRHTQKSPLPPRDLQQGPQHGPLTTTPLPHVANATNSAHGNNPGGTASAATTSGDTVIASSDLSGQGQGEKEKESKEVPVVVNPYQEHGVPVQNSTPQPVKERKVLSYKKKDGSTLDIQSFQKKEESASVPAVTDSASGPAAVADKVVASAVEPVALKATPVVTAEKKIETKVNPPVAVVTPAVSATTSVQPSPRVSPKTVPSPETVPVTKKLEAIAVPTVDQQLKDLRIDGPSPVDEDLGVAAALSPAIKSADLPVFIGTSTASSAAATGVPSINSTTSTFEPSFSNHSTPRDVSTPRDSENVQSGHTPTASRSKKSSKKDFLAKADAAAASSELSAYESAAPVAAPKPSVVADLKVTTPRVSNVKSNAAAEASIPDSWDDDAELNLSPLITPTEPVTSAKESRSLRPGGNKSFNINLHQAVAVVRFSKAEIIALRPSEKIPNPLNIYNNITAGDPSAPTNAQKSQSWNKGQGQRGDGRNQDGGDGWKRDNLPPQAPSSASKHKKQNSNVPMPKKVISNQMELLATETMAILNKITPQTFEKLSQNMLALNVQNIAQMSKVIELIFEKAVQEQGFANLYAELCAFLNSKATHWAFYEVFRVITAPTEFQNEFFWVRECSFPPVYAGPYFSQTECVAALHCATSAELPPMVPLAATLEPVAESWLLNQPDLLVKVYRNTTTGGYYVTYLPFSEYGEETRSQNTFGDIKLAQKDAKNKHYFRAKLVTNCQVEFQQSTMNEHVYSELEAEKSALLANKATLSEAELFYKNADIDDRRLKLKRRMLGNIRFVGELFKQKLLTDVTIQDCISDLMGTPDSWKDMKDEQDIECLCHLLRTAGERLEAKFSSSHEALRNFNMHFDRLRVLSRDTKNLNSRMRFAIEEVLSLRDNGWQKRGGLEGPVKISEIHRKIHEEASAPHHQSSPMLGNNRGGPGGPKSNAPQQQRMSILPRPGSGPGAGRGGQDARKGQDEKFGRTQSAGYDAQREYNNRGDARPQGGDSLRRVQSEYSPPVSGTATPNSNHSSHSNTHGGAHQRSASVSSIAAELDFSDSKILNRAKSVISEYIEQKDFSEVKVFLSEGAPGVYGYFVLQLLDKFLNATKEPVLSAIRDLLKEKSLGEVLSSAQSEIVQALRTCETLKCMPDTTMDIKEAPERFATVLGSLVQFSALSEADITSLMAEAKVNCIDELGNSEGEWATVYSRFARQLATFA